MPKHPEIYEINTRVWLNELSRVYEDRISLENVPAHEWLKIKQLGFDWVWLMGVWEKSELSQQLARSDHNLMNEYDKVLPGWKEADIIGSPYAVKAYKLNNRLGSDDTLGYLRSILHHYGLYLMLDFVPNHTALDHAWISGNPDLYIQQTTGDQATNFNSNGKYIAFGRDPNFPSWQDTAQLNYFNPETRKQLTQELLHISAQCDGLRCDMAMLVLNDVFYKTWGKELDSCGWDTPGTEFWSDTIAAIKQSHPGFLFLAEVYWGREDQLHKLGFDLTYDKELYDKLLHANGQTLRTYLKDQKSPNKWLRFIENHDEKRAYTEFGEPGSEAAALLCASLPGGWLHHFGQEYGLVKKMPVQIGVLPPEEKKYHVFEYYRKLGNVLNRVDFSELEWELLETEGWPDNNSHEHLIAYQWANAGTCFLFVINRAQTPSQGKIRLTETGNLSYGLRDLLTGIEYSYPSADIQKDGLFVDLPPLKAHVFELGNCD